MAGFSFLHGRRAAAWIAIAALILASVASLLSYQVVFAADTINSSVYLDSDDDGTVDRIRWTFDENVTACVYEAGDWTVDTASEMTLSITGLSCTGSDAILDILVSADADETGAATDPVVSYDNQGNLNDLTLTSGNMAAHASVTATDGAKPVLLTVDVDREADSGITYNTLEFNYSEALVVSTDGGGDADISGGSNAASTATLGGMTTAKTLAGIATWDGSSDMTTNDATYNRVDLNAGATQIKVFFNTAVAGYFNAGSTAPSTDDFTPVEDASDISDAAGNAANSSQTAVTATESTAWDVTAPTVSTTYSCDADADGDIDRIQVDFSEVMIDSTIVAANFEADNDSTNDGTGEETANAFATATGGCDGNADDTDSNDDKGRFTLSSGITGTEAAYLHNVTGGARDHAGNRLATGAGLGTETDRARPVVMSVSPTESSTNVARSADVVITFSEAMDTTFDYGTEFSASPNPSGWSEAFSSGDTVVTLSHSNLFATTSAITITTDEGEIDAAAGAVTALLTSGPEDGDWSFTTGATASGNSGGSSAPKEPKTYSMNVLTPDGGETVYAGDPLEITWESGGTGTQQFVSIAYSTDGGSSYTTFATAETNDGSYTWTVPDMTSENVRIRVTGTDLALALATDASDTDFTIVGSTPLTTPQDEGDNEELAPGTGEFGISPVTGEVEEISAVSPGDVIRGASFDTLYMVTDSMGRRPFLNQQIYFTWYSDFNGVKTVTDATLRELSLGGPMLPKPGAVLIKITTDKKVYALEASPTDDERAVKRWVPSEGLAASLIGVDWADFVIDVPDTLFARFDEGMDITSADADSFDRESMVKRLGL